MDDSWTIIDICSEDSDDEIKLHPGAIRYRNDFAAKIWKRKRSTSNDTKMNNEVDYNDRNPLTPAFTKFIKPRKASDINDQPTSRLRKPTTCIKSSSLYDNLGTRIPGDSQSRSYRCSLKEKPFVSTEANCQKPYPSRYPKLITRKPPPSAGSRLSDLFSWKPWSPNFAENERKIWMGNFKPVTPIREECVEYDNKRSISTHPIKPMASNPLDRKLKMTTTLHDKFPPIPATTGTVSNIPRRAFTYNEASSSELKGHIKSNPTTVRMKSNAEIDGQPKSYQNVLVGNPSGITKWKKSEVTSIVKHAGPSGYAKPIQIRQPETPEPNKQSGLNFSEPWRHYPAESKQKKWMADLKAVTPIRNKYSYVRNDHKKLTNVVPRPLDDTSLRKSYRKEQGSKRKQTNKKEHSNE